MGASHRQALLTVHLLRNVEDDQHLAISASHHSLLATRISFHPSCLGIAGCMTCPAELPIYTSIRDLVEKRHHGPTLSPKSVLHLYLTRL